MLPRLAWVLAALTGVLVSVDVVISAQAVSLVSETAVAVHGFPFVHGAVLGSAVMGALIVSRYERHPIGWLLTVVGATSALSLCTEAYAYWVQEAGGPGPAELGGVAAWISSLLGGQVAIAAMALMFLLAPDGHLLSRRWRYAAWLTVIGAASCMAAVLTLDPTSFHLVMRTVDLGVVRASMLSFGFLAITVALVASVVSLLLRLRGSTGVERQRIQLIALAAALIALGIVCLLAVDTLDGGRPSWLSGVPLFVAYFLLPILFAVAVLRHRLYDLDVILNRTVLLVAATTFAAVGYTALVVLAGDVVQGQTGAFWPSLVATSVVALAFQPVRRQATRLAARLAYGSRAQPYEELADFSRRLSGTPSAATLLPAVAAAAGQALAARRATALLSVPGMGTTSGSWGSDDGGPTDLHRVPVEADGTVLGSIEVQIPRGRRLRPSDERRLRALADQAAVAFRNAAMESRLTGHVAELGRRTRELTQSRSRIIAADDAVRRRLEGAISRDVLPHLVSVADGIGRRAGSGGADAADAADVAVEQLVSEVNAALEALRELTRGIFPTQLGRAGIEPALRSFLGRTGLGTTLTVDPAVSGVRFPARVESAAYFVATQAAVAVPRPTSLDLRATVGGLRLEVHDVDEGTLDEEAIVDRVEAAGGSLAAEDHHLVLTLPGDGTLPESAAAGGPRR